MSNVPAPEPAGTRSWVRPYFAVTVSAAALAFGAGLLARHRSRKAAGREAPAPAPQEGLGDNARELTRRVIQYFVVPVWTAAGVADWWCHRASDIQDTTGAKETLIHLAMLAEAGTCVVAGLLLEVNAPVLALMIGSFFLHEATAMWDVDYAVTAREVTPIEQHVHSFLEMVPLMAVAFVSLLHWPQLEALAGRRVEPLAPLVRPKREPLGLPYVAGTLGSLLLLELLPYLEELRRDWRAHPGRLEPPATRAA